jgi:hypothetical protein
VAGLDGRTLHLAWQAQNGNLGAGVYYAPFDTRTMQWAATDFELAKGVDANTQFLEPVIDITRRGVVGVAYYTHRQGPWAGQLRVLSGGTWAPVQKVNVDTYGVLCNLTAHGDDFHLAYRTNAGLYGIRYRRFDTSTMAFGAEGEVMVSQANPLVTTASSANSIAVAPNGDIYIVYSSGAATAGGGVIWLAYAASGTYAFTTHVKVADDAPLQGGNFAYYHYSVGLGATGVPHVIYSLANETYAKLYWRFSLGGPTLGPQLQLAAGANDSFQWAVASRLELTKLGLLATLTDRSVAGGQATFLQATSGVALYHGLACQGASTQLPSLETRGLPGLGAALNLDLGSLPASTQCILALGASDTAYGPLPLPFDLAILGAPGCLLTQDAPIALGFASSGQGTATLALTVPNNPGLAGVPLFFQALVVAPGANPVGLILTNGIAAIAR